MFDVDNLAIQPAKTREDRPLISVAHLVELAFSRKHRRRGPIGQFSDKRKLTELIVLLAEPTSTVQAAANHFGCSKSTIEKTINRLRTITESESAPAATVNGSLTSTGLEPTPHITPSAQRTA